MGKKYSKTKLLLSTTLVTSAFVSTINVDAAQNTSAEKWVKEAENLAGALKWAISIEGKESIPEIPWALYNQTKQAKTMALEAIKTLPKKERTILEARLQENVDLYISTTPGKVGRVVAYIDAITAGKKIEEKKAALEQKLNNNEIDDATEKAYHNLSWELKKQSILLDRVYGQSTRNMIRDHYKKSAESVKEAALYPVTIKIELDRANAALANGNLVEANKRIKAADEFLKVALEKGYVNKGSALLNQLTSKITLSEQKYNTEVAKANQSTSSSEPSYSGGGSYVPPTIPSATYDTPGIHGPNSGVQVINGDVTISSSDVTLQNVVIKGNLLISEAVAEGDVRLKNVKVEGQTLVKGGGENSIYFEDSVLATVIVNKNNGAIRIVATGNTHVVEVQLESYVRIEERNLSIGADGFTSVTVSETVQSINEDLSVELIGSFETINSRATQVRINLAESTDIRTLILNAAATVLGSGRITTAEVNANGSTISSVPQNIVLDNGAAVVVDGERITESSSNIQLTTLTSASATPSSVSLGFRDFVSGITLNDLRVTAKIDGQDVTLDHLEYNSNHKRLTYTIPNFAENIGKTLTVTVAPANESTKLSGNAVTASTQIKHGFAGRITDVSYVGVADAVIKFRNGFDNREGTIVAEAVTDQYGYYQVYVEPGQYTGEISGNHLVTSYIIGSSLTDRFRDNYNETAIRAAASSEVKIMLTWDEHPWDLDSHLVGPGGSEDSFHTFFGDKIYNFDGINFVDLDWDDTESYGPETTSLRKLTDGRYIFYVHDWTNDRTSGSGTDTLKTSNAMVQVFKGNQQAASHTFTVPTGQGSEVYWVVFAMDISNNGQDINVLPINLMEEANIFYLNQTEQYQWYLQPQQSLEAMVTISDQLVDEAVEGTQPGEYQEGAIAAFKGVIDEVKLVTSTELPELVKAIKKLALAKNTFESLRIQQTVVDTTPPVIADVVGGDVAISDVATWIAPSTTASDNVDGDISGKIVVTYSSEDEGSNVTDLESARTHLGNVGNTVKVTYSVTDEAGNEAEEVSATFTSVSEIDTTPPVIADVIGGDVAISDVATWVAPQTTATDNVDGDINDKIVVTYSSDDEGSDVTDLESARTHLETEGNTVKVTYSVTDEAGNEAEEVSATFTSVADTDTTPDTVLDGLGGEIAVIEGKISTSFTWKSLNGIGTAGARQSGNYNYYDDGSYLRFQVKNANNEVVKFADIFETVADGNNTIGGMTLQTNVGDIVGGINDMDGSNREKADWGVEGFNSYKTNLPNDGNYVFYGLIQHADYGTKTVGFSAGDSRTINMTLTPKTGLTPGVYTVTVEALQQGSNDVKSTITYTFIIEADTENSESVDLGAHFILENGTVKFV
ncbi:hypothetical protein RRV45_20465 [Bacillus sp. DTU_2020_1000418_1_SI_GHA_SEK_038]|uniref:hypothetical protein n=1 Tax=Bacillus sp. DTU_2020_1000418_1_SI_GHA_SEK_038 TaxID=3077585 RepID=UPI0028ECD904|nr:hypothetical protein [Bacillus sp. DTU_2020_1000418_1_SI_GHA_SEK_038]WNS75218.1 hypothetical protein RRV45_20465 [Bacillus sp. DTU_2020_1000418_1_SI_GHA_SEK_038]